MESLHAEVYGFLSNTEKSIITMDESLKTGIERQIIEMKDLLNMERNEYEVVPSYFSFVPFILGFNVFVLTSL
jgi:1-phosphatidylinositol-3-phosphate 5-kinase